MIALVSILGALSVVSMAATASSLYLANHAPLLLIAMAPLGRHLVLAAPQVHPLAFVLVGTARRLIPYVATYHIGRALGPHGRSWLLQRGPRMARFTLWFEKVFERSGWAVILFFAGPTSSTFAGMVGMRPRLFVPLVIASITLRMIGFLIFGELFREPIEWLLAMIDVYWREGTVVLCTALFGYQLWRRRRRANKIAEETASASQG